MGENTKIEWAHHTFNPWIGCTKVSAACDNCYAENMMDHRYGRVRWGAGETRSRTSPANWRKPLAWDRRCAELGIRERVFCASLADVFDNEVPDEWRDDLFSKLILRTPHLDWLLLTKRPAVARRYLRGMADAAARYYDDLEWVRRFEVAPVPGEPLPWPIPNVWLGTTVEHQQAAEALIPILLETPAAVRFLSCEPLLGPVDLTRVNPGHGMDDEDALRGCSSDDGTPLRPALDWVIAGGESGPGARPSHPDWFRSLRDQCVAAGVPFLFKQHGDWVSEEDFDCTDLMAPQQSDPDDYFPRFEFVDADKLAPGWHVRRYAWRVGKKRAGRTLDGRTWNEVPAGPANHPRRS